jgi:glycosyltransferase involved in cell wall biosynthesis
MRTHPKFSVIVPVFNGGKFLPACLEAIKASSYQSYELIVVDDGSTDKSVELAREHGAAVFRLPHRSGPAAARNFGAQKARGEILLFVDADVEIQHETLARLALDFSVRRPDVVAVFGSYDDAPAEQNFLSQYKNLYHHFIHQSGNEDASTFWAGCGAIRRRAFHAANGFDAERYARPCIEDIELGYRLRAAGQKILLNKSLQCKHLKHWTFMSLLRSDIFDRALPWSRLILERGELANDLNLQVKDRASTALVGLMLLTLLLSVFQPAALLVAFMMLLALFFINHRLVSFFSKLKGPGFVAGAFAMQLLYYFYSGVAFSVCLIQHVLDSKSRAQAQLSPESST